MDRYSRLKLNTKCWVQWLCQTADAHGSPTQTTPRPNSTLSDVTTQEILRQADFLEKYSFANDIKYTMPRSVWHSYKSAYKERVRYAARYAEDDRVQVANAGHQYFNGVMDSVQEQLRSCVDVVAIARPTEEATVEASTESLSGIFERLHVADPDSEDSDTDEVVESLTDHLSEASTEDQPDLEPVLSSTYERRMRIYYLRDMIEEQAFGYLKNLWIGTYSNGDALVSTTVASFLTSVALALIGQWEDTINEDLPQLHKDNSADIVTNVKDPMFIALLTLGAVAKKRAASGKGYRLGLKPLDVRQPDERFGLSEKEYQNMVGIDTTGIQLMMELALQNEIMDLWKDVTTITMRRLQLEAPLLPECQDPLSRVLQTVNEGQGYNPFQTAFAFKMLMFIGRPDLVDRYTALFSLDRFCLELDVQAKNIRGRFAPVHDPKVDTLRKKLETVFAWVSEGPDEIIAGRELWDQGHKTASESARARLQGAIKPSTDPQFLRKMNPVSCGMLELILRVLGEEYGLLILNQAPTIYAMSYLYKTLKSKGKLSGNAVMHDLEHVIKHHGQEMFGSLDFSQSTKTINNVMKIQAGGSVTSLASNASTTALLATGPKTWDIETSDTIKLLRDFVHERLTFLELLHRFDKMITDNLAAQRKKDVAKARLSKKKSKGKFKKALKDDTSAETSGNVREEVSLLETDVVAFLTELRKFIEESLERLSFDYIAVHCACQSLFKDISSRIGPLPGKLQPPSDWRQRTPYPMSMVDSIFNQLGWALEEEARQEKLSKKTKNSKKPVKTIEAKFVQDAVTVIEEYCQKGGKGFAD